MNEDSIMPTFGGVVRTSAVARKKWIKRVGIYGAALLAAAFVAITLSNARQASAHREPANCTFNGPSTAISVQGEVVAAHGETICYIVLVANSCPGCCQVTGLNTNLTLPNGTPITITTNATLNQGDSFLCPGPDPRCMTPSNCPLGAPGYAYVVNHADEKGQTGTGCPIVPVAGTGTVWASISGTGVDHVSTQNGTASICQSIPVEVLHACCEPCSGSCTDRAISECPPGSNFSADKTCNQVVCTPRVCLGPVPPCEAGQTCSTDTGQCVDLPDPPPTTICETDQNLCTPEHCSGTGTCVSSGPPVTCPGPIPPCEGGQACNPQTGLCVSLPDAVLSTPCEAETPPNLCTIDHCDGQGNCVQLRTVCDDTNFSCDDHNACTLDICDITRPGCCRYRDITCPPRPCFRITGCNPITGCQYTPDCSTGELAACCPDDGNPCTHEFCNQANGICGSTPDCTTPADCGDGLNCTVDSCVNSCCGHRPLCIDNKAGVPTFLTTAPICCADGASCDDHNACTDDSCPNGCCSHTPHVCPPRPCFRITGCDPVDGCQYAPDCRTPGVNCCPDDGNPCTHEFCNQANGICGSTPDCRTPADCNDGLNCTVDTCTNSCCGHEPLCNNTPPACPCGAGCTLPSGLRGTCINTNPDGGGECSCVDTTGPTECEGQTCATFTTCNPGSPNCGSSGVCVTTAEGGGSCLDGSTLCSGLLDCTSTADCTGGGLCAVNTCCVRPVCVPESRRCQLSPPVDECTKEAACSAAEVCTRPDGCQGACFFTSAGTRKCFAGEFGCDQAACTSDGDCPSGSACSNTCCGLQCVPLCGNPFPAAASADKPSSGSSSNINAAGGVQPDGLGICCADGASCDDHNACTDDDCGDGCCVHTPHICPPRDCYNLVGCDPSDGCMYEPIVCEGTNCTFNPDAPGCCDCGCDPGICRPKADQCDIAECCVPSEGKVFPGTCPDNATYDLNGDGCVDKADFSLFSQCWLLCPIHKDYVERHCDRANFVHCPGVPLPYPLGTWCVGTEDFAYFMTAFGKCCNDMQIVLPPVCCNTPTAASELLPLPTNAMLIEYGLTVPPADWEGYQAEQLPVLPEPVPASAVQDTRTLGGLPVQPEQPVRERTVKEKRTIRQRSPR